MSELQVDTGQQGVQEISSTTEIQSELKGSDILGENDRLEGDSGIASDQTDSSGSKSDSQNRENFSPDSDVQDKLTETSDTSECQEPLPSDSETSRLQQQNDEEKQQSSPSNSPGGDTTAATETPGVNHSTQNQNVANDSLIEGTSLGPKDTAENSTELNNSTANNHENNIEIAENSESSTIENSAEKSPQQQVDSKTDLKEESALETQIVAPPVSGTSKESEEEEGAAAATTPTSECSSKGNGKSPGQSVYHVKWIRFKSNTVPIVTQNENGPCPLLGIMNVLLLKGLVKFPPMIEMVTSGQLMDYLADCIFEHVPKDISDATRLNYEQNMIDAMAVFDKLQTGLDVNVRFTGVADFEYTRECIVFDLLSVPLYHGWLVDPEDPTMAAAIGSLSYNQLVEKIISHKQSADESLVREALMAEDFLERTASQLTYHGLSELAGAVKEEQLCIFFRNNHFSTLYRFKNELFLLVTDQGFLTESNVIWETLSNVEGDGHFVDADFRTYTKPEPVSTPVPDLELGSDQQIDHDYLVALSLQEEQQVSTNDVNGAMGWQGTVPASALTDHELAMQLQDEENRRAAAAQQQQQQQQTAQPQPTTTRQQPRQQPSQNGSSSSNNKSKKSDCTIL